MSDLPPDDGDEIPEEDDVPVDVSADFVGGIEGIEIQEEMERSFLDYAMSVIVSRALPDARDGLKPVHRRILYGMHDMGARSDRPRMKCARVSGEVMGKFHPHGDSSIYDALVRMAQPFSLREPLIDFHGNLGSPDFPAAAARYTECRLALLANEMLAGIDENTVDFEPNYTFEFEQPTVLPSRFPNLLVNGSQGIAVGMATNIPPHNLGEVIDATIHLIDNPDATPDDLMKFVTGPDFPTGALILGRQGILDAYRTGRGSIQVRAKAEIEEDKKGAVSIVVSELPYQASINAITTRIAELVNNREIDGIRVARRPVLRYRHQAGDRPQARRQRAGRAEQPVQAHAAADQLRREHGRARRRRAPHAEPRHRAVRRMSTTRSRSSRRRSEFRLKKAQGPRPHRRRPAQGPRHDRQDHRVGARLGRPRRSPRRAHGRAASSSPRSRPTTSST